MQYYLKNRSFEMKKTIIESELLFKCLENELSTNPTTQIDKDIDDIKNNQILSALNNIKSKQEKVKDNKKSLNASLLAL